MKIIFRKSVTENDIEVSTNSGNMKLKIFGKISEKNLRKSITKFVTQSVSGNDTVSDKENAVINGNFLVVSRKETTATYECDYNDFLKIAVKSV